MVASNIFRWIGSFFTDLLFLPYEWFRLEIATADLGWWLSNGINWGFMLILLVLFSYWMTQCVKFSREGTEDRA